MLLGHARRYLDLDARQLGAERGDEQPAVERAQDADHLRMAHLDTPQAREQGRQVQVVEDVHARPVGVLDLARAGAADFGKAHGWTLRLELQAGRG